MNLTENSKGAIASFWDFDWGANIHRNERRAFPDETILATVYERADHMKGLTPGWDKDMHFVHSTDFFKSAHTRLVACGNQFEVIGHKVCTHGQCRPCRQLGRLCTTQDGADKLFVLTSGFFQASANMRMLCTADLSGAAVKLSNRP